MMRRALDDAKRASRIVDGSDEPVTWREALWIVGGTFGAGLIAYGLLILAWAVLS